VKFTAANIAGVWSIELTPHRDERGSFARVWCAREFSEHGIEETPVQANVACNAHAGTLRGMHWQAAPHEEGKLVRCAKGAAHVVVLDLREHSPTRLRSASFELTASSGRQIWAPPGCALGYQTLTDETEICYLMSHAYVPDAGRGLRYNDPSLHLQWPLPVTVISAADQSWPDYSAAFAS
jgi:dTDP-4-dehydrorhamnose 3,5-epimerase